ncbi:MAG: hypothetical protein LT071_13185 [Nocardioides sp.]|nr:hypothetical protein [Nocardioides sp.]
MGWEEQLFDVFDDLEGQARALWAADREAELADRAHSEYASVTLASRLMASLGTQVDIEVRSVGRVSGEVSRVGADWCLLGAGGRQWIVSLPAVVCVSGAAPRSVPEVAWSPVHRLTMSSALRRLADSGQRCVVRLVDGRAPEGRVLRVGADFLELRTAGDEPVLLARAAVVAVHCQEA